MQKNSKIYIAGHNGLVGSAILRNLKNKGYSNFVFSPHKEYDLTNQSVVKEFFKKNNPEYVVLAAAKVGGIVANNTYRAEFIYENLMIQSNIIHQAYLHKVKKMLILGSSCIYPKLAPQPMKEEYLLSDILEYTNEPYAISKIAGLKMAESYNLQYGTNFLAVMPTNLYGPNDNFDLEKSHVLPALVRKMHLAKCFENNDFEAIRKDLHKNPIENINQNADKKQIIEILSKYGINKNEKSVVVELWGSGSPKREFLHSNDLAEASIFLMENTDFEDILKNNYGINEFNYPLINHELRNTHINLGTGKDISIKELALMIKKITGFNGQITWNTNKPDGTPRKLLDVSAIKKLGWEAKISLENGVRLMYKDYSNK
ncbi:MAG: GDP-L-fucose synthase [Bacteroidota bacterium]|nr:GDP-L-fucose synthase [Bacteroidota bacterium]